MQIITYTYYIDTYKYNNIEYIYMLILYNSNKVSQHKKIFMTVMCLGLLTSRLEGNSSIGISKGLLN